MKVTFLLLIYVVAVVLLTLVLFSRSHSSSADRIEIGTYLGETATQATVTKLVDGDAICYSAQYDNRVAISCIPNPNLSTKPIK